MIIKVDNIEDCQICDNFLTLLIQDERTYNNTIEEGFVVKDYFINMIKKDTILLLYKNKEIPQGYVFAKKWEDGYLINGLYVDVNFRNQGIATKLMKEIIKQLKNNLIYLVVLKANEKAFNLYQKLGFAVISDANNKLLMRYQKRDEDE